MNRIVRFAAVGALATCIFMLGQYLFIGRLGLTTVIGTTLSFAISLPASYFGHHAVTFRRSGAHLHYGWRFAVVTAAMLIVSNLAAYGMVEIASVNYLVASAVIGILYPVGSFLLQSLWVFAARSGDD